jgi:hypothetical protein
MSIDSGNLYISFLKNKQAFFKKNGGGPYLKKTGRKQRCCRQQYCPVILSDFSLFPFVIMDHGHIIFLNFKLQYFIPT